MSEHPDTNAVEALIALNIYRCLTDEWGGVPEGIAEQARAQGIQSLSKRQFKVAENFVREFCRDKRCAVCATPIGSHDVVMYLSTETCAHHAHVVPGNW
jgi:hypothetical protein